MTARNKGVAGSEQRLVWDAENRLAEVQDAGGNILERYGYDAGGARVRKVSGATATYHPYGSERSAWGTLHTDRTFTGQKGDGTGLLYYNTPYYDPALGTLISPDALVPDSGWFIDSIQCIEDLLWALTSSDGERMLLRYA